MYNQAFFLLLVTISLREIFTKKSLSPKISEALALKVESVLHVLLQTYNSVERFQRFIRSHKKAVNCLETPSLKFPSIKEWTV